MRADKSDHATPSGREAIVARAASRFENSGGTGAPGDALDPAGKKDAR
jgi:hypothetical protein